MGLRAVVHADVCKARPLRLLWCLLFLWPNAPYSGGGRLGGYQGSGKSSIFPDQGSSTRVSVRVDFFDEAVCGVRCAGHVLRTAYCAAKGVSAETKPCLVCILPVLFPIQATTKGGSPIRPADSAWAHLILVVITRLAATLSSVSRAGQDHVGRCETRLEPSQRKLSLSSRDDPNYKDIMRLRAQLADTL